MAENFEMEKIWNGVMGAMKMALSGPSWSMFLKPTRLAEIREREDRLVCEVGCASGMVRDNVEQRFKGQLAEELERILGRKCEVVLKIQGMGVKERESESEGLPLFEEKKIDRGEFVKARLKEENTFENYAVGGSNQIAFAAGQAVAKKPGSAYNPLFIHGGVGVGKTHLMQAVGHAVLEEGERRVLFCTSEQFTNDLVEGIRNKTTDKVRSKYRKLKLLMLDDVQFMAGKGSAQEEFFHTFNEILSESGQIVLTSDRAPAEIPKLEARLKSRFGAGLVVEIGQPDLELKMAIVLIKARQRGVEMDMRLAEMIAQKIEGVRELEGVVVRLLAESGGGKIEQDTVEKLLKLKPAGDGMAKVVTPADAISGVAGFYGVGIQLLKGERRTKTIAWPRQVLMYLLHTELKLPQEEVGRLLGGRDHSTVIHARDKIKTELETDVRFRNEYNEIKKRLFTISG